MKDMLRTFVAEFVGTFALVFVGGAAIMNTRGFDSAAALVAVALAHGLILALLVSAFMRVSAAFNPAVSVALVATRKIDPTTFLVHLVAQLLGALIAAKSLQTSFPADAVLATRVGGQWVSSAITTWQAFSLEAIATAFLVFVVFGTAVDPKGPKIGGLAIGLTITAGILAIGPLTGGSMNPARSFGPAVISGIFEGHLLYWVAPIVGALVAGFTYDLLFLRGDASAAA